MNVKSVKPNDQIKIILLVQFQKKQECIPVGCVPAARRPYAGVCFPGGVLHLGGGGVLHPGGGSPSGGVCLGPGGGGMASQHALRQTPSPPPCGQTHTCKNITLATTSLLPVMTPTILPDAPLFMN